MKTDRALVQNDNVVLGIDVAMNRNVVTVEQQGRPVKTMHMPTTPGSVDALLARLPGCQINVVYEAGPDGFNLYREFARRGIACKVVAPSLVPVAPGMKNRKNDARDSRRLAASYNQLRGIAVPTTEQEAARRLLRTREQMVGHRTQFQQQVRSMLRMMGIRLNSCRDAGTTWGPKRFHFLEKMDMPTEVDRQCLDHFVTILWQMHKQIQLIEKDIRCLAESETYRELVERYTAISGVGLISAMVFITEIFDPTRFPSDRQLGAYLGLVPSEYSTGERTRQGGILSQGNKHIRRVLVQCAWQWQRRDERAKQHQTTFYKNHGVKQKGVGQKAVVSLARLLAKILWAMWRDGTAYRPLAESSLN